MRELAHLVVSEFHLRAFIVGLGILLGFNYGIQHQPSVVSFIATIGSSGPTLSLPASHLSSLIPIQAEFFFSSRSVLASFRTTPTSTTILPSPTTSIVHWLVPSQTKQNTDSEFITGIPGLPNLSSTPVSKLSIPGPSSGNSTLDSSKALRRRCRSSRQHSIEPYFAALQRVLVVKRSLQSASPPKKGEVEGVTGPTHRSSHSTSDASQELVIAVGPDVQATSGFTWVEILVLPALLAVVIRLAVCLAFVVVASVRDFVTGSIDLCVYSARVLLNFPQGTPLELTRRQGRLRGRLHKKGVLPPNTASISLRSPGAIQTFLYAPEQRVILEHVILRDEHTSATIPSSKDLYDPRYLVIVKPLGGRTSIVKNSKDRDDADTEGGHLVLKTVSRHSGGYRLLQFAQELRALDRVQGNRWCRNRVASFAGPEDLHMLMTYYPRGHLADFIAEAGGHLSRAQAKYYLVELFIAIRTIHKMGVFHRGIALENLFLTDSGHLVISDFRNAKIDYDSRRPSEDEVDQAAISTDGFRDYFAMIQVYYNMVTGNPLSDMHSKRPTQNITKNDNSFFKLVIKPFSEDRRLPSPMDMQKHAIFDRINWDAMQRQLVAVPTSPAHQLRK